MKNSILYLLLLLALPVSAQMGSHLKEEFQNPEKHGIRIVDSVSGIRGVIHDLETKILCLQSFGEQLPPEVQQELLEWVRLGHTVWFYDVRMAPGFGMREYRLDSEQFRNKAEKGVLGGSKRSGLATVALSFGQHAVQTGVGQVTLFLPEIPSEADGVSYGALEVAGDTVALLQFALDSPALVALRREGRGLIVFKALLWTEPLSGDRFQANLLDYSAGFQVPGPAGEGRVGAPPGPGAEFVVGSPAEPLQAQAIGSEATSQGVEAVPPQAPRAGPSLGGWRLELKDGTVLIGELEDSIFQFETGTGSLKLKPADIVSVKFGNSRELDHVTTTKGKTEAGLMLSSPVKFRTDQGTEKFEKEDLETLERNSGDVLPVER